jgi:hypothetical protein
MLRWQRIYGRRLPRLRLGVRKPPRDLNVVTHSDGWAACASSVDPGLMEAIFAELAADVEAQRLFHLLTALRPDLSPHAA